MKKIQIKKTTWDLSPLFKNDNDPAMEIDRKNVESANKKFIKKWKERDFLRDPQTLKEALDDYEKLQRYFGTSGKEGYYFWLRTNQDENNPVLKAKFNKITDFSNKLRNEIQFFELTIAKVPQDRQKLFLKDTQLQPYKHFLERLFAQSKYLLSEKEERILNLKDTPAHSDWIKMTSSFLAKEEREVRDENGKKTSKNFSEIISLMNNTDKKVRDSAADAFNAVLAKHADTAESEMNAILANKKIDDELRGLPRPDAARLLQDDIDQNVVDALLEAVAGRYAIAERFYKLKAQMFGVKKLEYHERNVPYGKIDVSYSFKDGVQLVHKVMGDLDPEFATIFEQFIRDGHIDVYPQKGKRGGAFCAYWLITQPTYMLLNYTDTLQDVTTLAHEFGHGVNDELMKQTQNSLTFGTPLSTAEVASTFMEDFVLDEILKGADDILRLSIMMMRLNSDISTIFRQVACYRFEQELHQQFREKGYLSNKDIGAIFQKHMASYMGKYVEQSEGSENWWVYWSHIRVFFYVYSYASGLLISKAMQNGVKQDPAFIKKVKGFLSAGLSDSPKNIFKKLGIDITDKAFWESGLTEIDSLLRQTEKLAKKVESIEK